MASITTVQMLNYKGKNFFVGDVIPRICWEDPRYGGLSGSNQTLTYIGIDSFEIEDEDGCKHYIRLDWLKNDYDYDWLKNDGCDLAEMPFD